MESDGLFLLVQEYSSWLPSLNDGSFECWLIFAFTESSTEAGVQGKLRNFKGRTDVDFPSVWCDYHGLIKKLL